MFSKNPGKETKRTYHISMNYSYSDVPSNITINVTYLCYKKSKVLNQNCGTGLRCCNYKKVQYSSSYNLINELC